MALSFCRLWYSQECKSLKLKGKHPLELGFIAEQVTTCCKLKSQGLFTTAGLMWMGLLNCKSEVRKPIFVITGDFCRILLLCKALRILLSNFLKIPWNHYDFHRKLWHFLDCLFLQDCMREDWGQWWNPEIFSTKLEIPADLNRENENIYCCSASPTLCQS